MLFVHSEADNTVISTVGRNSHRLTDVAVEVPPWSVQLCICAWLNPQTDTSGALQCGCEEEDQVECLIHVLTHSP